MKALSRRFANIFTSTTSAEEKERSKMYKSWNFHRSEAAKYGQNHVDEIDAIFSRNI